MRNKETALGIRRPLSGTRAGTGGGAGALVLTLLRNTVSELIKSGLFFGETTFYKAFLFSSQECLQNFSVSLDVCLVREQHVIPCVQRHHYLPPARARG